MKIKVLMDNNATGELKGEWGLAIYLEYQGRKILLDTGASGAFLDNAARMGVNVADIELAVLSHAHYDHADGMEAFFASNTHAPLYLQECCCENCYSEKEDGMTYIGVHHGWLAKHHKRLKRVEGDYVLLGKGIVLLPHSTPGLAAEGRKARMFTKVDGKLLPETFAHEQTLVLEGEKGLVVCNSCSHAGVDNIINEVKKAFPGRRIAAYVGGMHLFQTSDAEVLALAERLKVSGVKHIITGHCTGDHALELLSSVLGNRVTALHSGLEMELD